MPMSERLGGGAENREGMFELAILIESPRTTACLRILLSRLSRYL
jgi:hypothetical protein